SEENPGSNGYMRPNNQGLYNIVSTDVSGSPAQSNSPQIIGQKRGFVEEDNDEYNNSNQPIKYEFPEATTPSSSQSGSPKSSAIGYQLPGLGAGATTPGATPSTPQGYSNIAPGVVAPAPRP
ncbi:11051_t:CDS:2, partial [Gigaspora rosea]